MAIVELQGLSKTFATNEGEVQALKNISLSVEEGDIYGIIGMSGAGKSTLVRCINYLEVPTAGKVVVEGKGCKIIGKYSARGYCTWGPFKIVGGVSKERPTEEEISGAVDFYKKLSA